MAYVAEGRWIFVESVTPIGEHYVSAVVTQAGPGAGVAEGQLLLLELAGRAHSTPDVWPVEAVIARDLDGTWHPERGWATVTTGSGGWTVTASRTWSLGTRVLLADDAAVSLGGTAYIVAESQILATVTPD